MPGYAPSAIDVSAGVTSVAYGRRVYRLASGLSPKRETRWPRTAIAGVDVGEPTAPPLYVVADEQPLALSPRAPLYGLPGQRRYRYRARGLDTAWRTVAGPRPEIYLGQLPPGRFTVEVGLDLPGAPVTALSVVATRPWYRRRGAQLAAALALVAAAAAAVWRRVRARDRLLRLRADLRRTRLSAIASQMNPHFMFNALNSVQGFVLAWDTRSASVYLGRFARLMLEHSREELVPLRTDLEAMRAYVDLECLRTDRSVAVDFEVDPALPLTARVPPLLVQPFIENAFKHGLRHHARAGRRLLVRYRRLSERQLEVVVEDNGIGRVAAAAAAAASPEAAAGAGFATGAIGERIRLINEASAGHPVRLTVTDLYDEGGRAKGTRVVLVVPLHPAPATASRVGARPTSALKSPSL